jgi:hypothetical protein
MARPLTVIISIFVGFLALQPVTAASQEKKLVYLSWDIQSPGELVKDIDKLQDLPFDGLAIRTNWCYPFYSTGLGGPEGTIEQVKQIKWGRFTDNFIYMTAGKKVDWFDDKVWADDGDIMKNVRALAKIGAAAGCKGIIFEGEFVFWGAGNNTWSYADQVRHTDKTFAEFETMVRKRGVQVIKAINEYMPNTNFLTCFWVNTTRDSIREGKKAAKATDASKLYGEILQKDYYGLLNAFMCGILEGADPGTRVIEGDEKSYYNNTAKAYQDSYKGIKEDAFDIIPKDLQEKYRRQVQCSFPIFADYLSNGQSWHTASTYLTPAERAKWMEHNVYWALETSDHYVWFYTEKLTYLRHKGIGPGMIAAITEAEDKVAAGQPLGFNIMEMVQRGVNAMRRAESRPIVASSVKVPKLGQDEAVPEIDGNLNDKVWKKAAVLGPFKNYAIAKRKELYGSTTARMIYDDKTLYIAFICKDPNMPNVTTPKFENNLIFWTADDVELEFAADPQASYFYHIKIGVDNTRWDALTKSGVDAIGSDSSWTGTYQTAVQKQPDSWIVEMAIPWSTLKMTAPKSGDKLRGNLERRTHRWSDNDSEFSSWSERRTVRSPEAEHFGTLIFE